METMREVVGREENDDQEDDGRQPESELELELECLSKVTKQGPFFGLSSSCKAVIVDGMSRRAPVRKPWRQLELVCT